VVHKAFLAAMRPQKCFRLPFFLHSINCEAVGQWDIPTSDQSDTRERHRTIAPTTLESLQYLIMDSGWYANSIYAKTIFPPLVLSNTIILTVSILVSQVVANDISRREISN